MHTAPEHVLTCQIFLIKVCRQKVSPESELKLAAATFLISPTYTFGADGSQFCAFPLRTDDYKLTQYSRTPCHAFGSGTKLPVDDLNEKSFLFFRHKSQNIMKKAKKQFMKSGNELNIIHCLLIHIKIHYVNKRRK